MTIDEQFIILSYVSGFDVSHAHLLSPNAKLRILSMMKSGECGIIHDHIIRRQLVASVPTKQKMPTYDKMYPITSQLMENPDGS